MKIKFKKRNINFVFNDKIQNQNKMYDKCKESKTGMNISIKVEEFFVNK
jgi:hypothetical protein